MTYTGSIAVREVIQDWPFVRFRPCIPLDSYDIASFYRDCESCGCRAKMADDVRIRVLLRRNERVSVRRLA
jgi:hypothetical protein